MIMSIGKVNRAYSGVVLGLILCASPGLAQRPAHRSARAAQKPQQPPVGAAARPHSRAIRYTPNRYIVFLSDAPVASRFATRDQLQTSAAITYRRQVEARQQSVVQDLIGRKIAVAGSASMVANAIFVVATPDRLAELRSVPGVIGVMPERSIRPNLNKATAIANAPAAWAQSAIGGQSNAGAGIKIAILDTGIDAGSVHTSPAFNDAGFTAPSGYPKCNAVVNGAPSDCGLYTNNKVIVARSYVSMIASGNCIAATLTGPCTSTAAANPAVSVPDDYSARDRNGHGSAVAATAAGVQNSGGTVAFSGMAPKAFLGSYKVYGTDGVNSSSTESVIIKALDDAIADGMNVINYSSGVLPFAGAKDDVQCGNKAGVPCDPLANAFEVAAQTTVIVVSAGNDGGDPYGYFYYNTIESPGTAPSVITVGATINSHVFNPTVSVNGSGIAASLKNITAALSDSVFSPSGLGANSGILVDVTTLGDNGQACSPLPAGSLTDSYALIQRSPASVICTFDTKAQNALAAGAIGIVFYNVDTSTLSSPGGLCYQASNNDCFFGPAVMVSLGDGQAIKAYVDAHPGTTVTIDTAGSEGALPSGTTANTLAFYSSEGPAIDGSIKPDLVATGGFDGFLSLFPSSTNGIYTVGQSYDAVGELYSSNGYIAANGTSFSSPLVAGAAAMVLQAHPTWSALQVKSALVNYAAQTVTADDNTNNVDVQEIGAGLLDANAAVTASVTTVPSTLSFGYLATGTTLPKTIPVTVQNNGSASVTLAVAVQGGITAAAATVKADQTSITLAAGAKTTLNVSLSGTIPTSGGEYNGVVTLSSTSPAITVRMPYMFLVGDGSSPVVNPLWDMPDWQAGGYAQTFAAVNEDTGPLPVQVMDSWGVPIAGTSVVYTVSPTGSVTLSPVPGAAGSTGNAISFQPSNCTPGSSGNTVTCTTNNYGIAWVELVAGSTAVGSTNPATVDAVAAGTDITNYVAIIPKPTLTSVQDDGVFGTTLAPGSYVALFGTNFADPTYLGNPTAGDKVDTGFTNSRLPLSFDYVTVSFDAPASGSLPAISVPGYIEYVSTTQVNVFVPWELENYPSAQVKLSYLNSGWTPSNLLTVPLSNYTPAFFMYNSGSVFIADARDNNTGALITTTNPATGGEVLQLYCNGLGPVTHQPASGDPAPSGSLSDLAQTTTPVTVSIGGQNAPVIFAGLTPPFVGLYLVDVTVPSGLTAGNQPITVSVGGKTSPLSITGGGTTYQIVLPVK